MPIDDHNTLHFLYSVTPRAAGEPEKCEVYDMPHQHDDGRQVVETVIGTDMMAWVTQGPTTPRHLEHLGVSDRGIIMYRNALSEAIDAVERGEDPPGLVRNPEDNFPWIEIKYEDTPRRQYNLPGEADRRARLASLVKPRTAGRRVVSALSPKSS